MILCREPFAGLELGQHQSEVTPQIGSRETAHPSALPTADSDSHFYSLLDKGSPMRGFWSDKRVTVTGGAGFLGQHLVKRLETYGARVFVPRQRDYNLTALDACLKCLLEHPCD